jgi:hypothetical protein
MEPLAKDVGIWVLILIALVPAVDKVMGWLRTSPQKREVSFADQYATTSELKRVENDLSTQIHKIDTDLRNLKESINTNGEERRVRIEAKVEEAKRETRVANEKLTVELHLLARELASLQTVSQTHGQKLVMVDSKLDRMMERINGNHHA